MNGYDSFPGKFIDRLIADRITTSFMKVLVTTNNPVTISFVEVLLKDAKIDCLVLDQNMSILEGSIVIIPRRIMVPEDDWSRASRLLKDAGLEAELSVD